MRHADLTTPLAEKLLDVVRKSGLEGDALLDVCRELTTHVEDGLRAGRTEQELLADLGADGRLPGLIAREKRRAEPDMRDRSPVSGAAGSPLPSLGGHVRYALRRARQSPGFTLTAILSLAIGIGANTAIFTLVHHVLLSPPPYAEPDRLVDVYIDSPDFSYMVLSYPEMQRLREGTDAAFEAVAASGLGVAQLEEEGRTRNLLTEVVSGNYFATLGVQAEFGRLIQESDERGETADAVVVLSYRYWRDAYGSDPDVVGGEMVLAGRPYTIVGVAPSEFTGSFRGLAPDIHLPALLRGQLEPGGSNPLREWGNHSYFAKGRLRPGATLEQANVLAANVAQGLIAEDRWSDDFSFTLIPSAEVLLFPPIDRFIRMAAVLLMVVVGIVLLIACANLASFLLARSIDRRREIAVRLALGASRGDLASQLAAEAVVLALMGGAVGVLLGSVALKLLINADLPLPVPITLDLGLNGAVLTFGLVASLGAGLLFGLLPVWGGSRTDVAGVLKNEATSAGRSRVLSMRGLLLAGQVAVSMVLLVGAGLFLRSFQATTAVDPGFGRDPAATVFMALPAGVYDDREAATMIRQFVDDFRAIPGVEAVGLTSNPPLNSLSRTNSEVQLEGVEPPRGRDGYVIDHAAVTPGYLNALGVSLLEGRDFGVDDTKGSEPVAIVNRALADRFWPGQSALGRSLRILGRDARVVGVMATTKVRNLGEPPTPLIYVPYDQDFSQSFHVVARTRSNPEALSLTLLSAARARDPLVWGWQPRSLERHIGIQLLPARLAAVVISIFAVVALVLAAIGLYGVVSYGVAQRRREVGIRMSLGAEAGGVIRMLMGTGLRPVVVGAVAGLVLALAASRLLASLLFGVKPLDPVAYGAVLAVFASVAAVAAWAPARRASRVNPVAALRAD
ncbi:MAG: ABC transporter permease [Gemmatimonadetes bacterium]|nr:ABC transporter permease [Gemmatimonadota bacterium]